MTQQIAEALLVSRGSLRRTLSDENGSHHMPAVLHSAHGKGASGSHCTGRQRVYSLSSAGWAVCCFHYTGMSQIRICIGSPGYLVDVSAGKEERNLSPCQQGYLFSFI